MEYNEADSGILGERFSAFIMSAGSGIRCPARFDEGLQIINAANTILTMMLSLEI